MKKLFTHEADTNCFAHVILRKIPTGWVQQNGIKYAENGWCIGSCVCLEMKTLKEIEKPLLLDACKIVNQGSIKYINL